MVRLVAGAALVLACVAAIGAGHDPASARTAVERPHRDLIAQSRVASARGQGRWLRVAVFLEDRSALSYWLRHLSPADAAFDTVAPRGALGRERSLAFERLRQRRLEKKNAVVARAGRRAAARIAPALRRLDARIVDAMPVLGELVVELPSQNLGKLANARGVAAVHAAPEPSPLSSTVNDGSPTWHAAGCTGAGAADTSCPAAGGAPGHVDSPDGHGGPDVAVDDQGIRITHQAWAGRNPPIVVPATRPADDTSVGSVHGNTIAAAIADKGTNHLGLAFGIDKVMDPTWSQVAAEAWMLGIRWGGVPGTSDLPESINRSFGDGGRIGSDDSDLAQLSDADTSLYGIAGAAAAGNSGPVDPFGNPQTQRRVEHPCVAYDDICVGATDIGATSARTDDTVAAYSSRGPSLGGRKKPDLLAEGTSYGCPSDIDDTTWLSGGQCGTGTSYATPEIAAGQLLLDGVGVTSPMAQKAVLINTSYMIDSETDPDSAPQQFWTPDAGWGELALEQTFPHRGDYTLGTVDGAPHNNARFYRVNGLTAGDRTTLAWNRRTIIVNQSNPATIGYTLTDLNLYQLGLDGSDDDADVCGGSSTCGVDSSESSEDAGPHAVTADNSDNVEQVRLKNSGDSIVKVEAASTIDGAPAEPFAVASDAQLIPLSTPTISAPTPDLSTGVAHTGADVTVTAQFTNDSTGVDLQDGLDLQHGQVTINLPSGVTLAPGSNPATQSVGGGDKIATGQTITKTWTVRGSTSMNAAISYTASGDRFGTTFRSISAPATLAIDDDPPAVSLSTPTGWQSQPANSISWTSSDSVSGVANVTVERSIDGGPYMAVYSGGSASGSAIVSGGDGQTVSVRVMATDSTGNSSAYGTDSWKIDVDPPVISMSGPAAAVYGSALSIPVTIDNVGSPVTAYYAIDGVPGNIPYFGGPLTIARAGGMGPMFGVTLTATDGLGRAVSKSLRIAIQPRPAVIVAHVVRRHRVTRLKLSEADRADGLFTVKGRCRWRRVEAYPVYSGRPVTVSLVRGRARCKLRVAFSPTNKYNHARAKRRLTIRAR